MKVPIENQPDKTHDIFPVRTMLPIDATGGGSKQLNATKDFKLAVGYFYSTNIILYDLMEWSAAANADGISYAFIDTKTSDVTFPEKPGISCYDSCILRGKSFVGSGSLDHRVRIFATKTLK